MCDWCEKETKGKPMVSGHFLPMICEHCGTKLYEILDYRNIFKWLKKWNKRK